MLDGKLCADSLARDFMSLYQYCRLGTGGMNFNWPSGTIGDTPIIIVEAMQIIDQTINAYQEEKREFDKQEQVAVHNRAALAQITHDMR